MQKRAIIYQIYPKSFGSLQDIAAKIPKIAKLKPDYIWLSPFFLSPWQDGGYDVADYKKIDSAFGDFRDFSHLISVAKKHHIGILLDLVINHTSITHEWFEKSRHRDPKYADYYVWRPRPLNWRSFFGGPAFDYDAVRGEYYLHLFDKSQPDLNFANEKVIKEFKDITSFWVKKGVSGFRVDSANVLTESALSNGFFPILPGFFLYYQTKDTIAILKKLFRGVACFTLAEPVGGNFLSHRKARELAQAFDAFFNVGTLDVADTWFSDKTRPLPLNYKKWFKKLVSWTTREPQFSFALESHDTPRATSRFKSDPKTLAMLQFLLPSNFPCIYQGQELGTKNPKLSNDINDYYGVQSHAMYHAFLSRGKSKKQAISLVKRLSRDNARRPLDWNLYEKFSSDQNSPLSFYYQIIELWKNDPVIINGKIKVKKINKKGVFDFERRHENISYKIHLDFSGQTKSTLIDEKGQILLSS